MNDPNAAAAPPVTHALAEFSLATSWADLPQRVRTEATRAFLNFAGCALGGSNTETVEAAVRAFAGFAGTGTVPLLGRRERFDATHAALLNCLSSAAHTFDDTHLKTITHPTGPVAAAILAVAHSRRVSGEQALLALALGMEIEIRISSAVFDKRAGTNMGWYSTGISGGIGAAVAAGILLGLNHDQMVCALGLAAAQAGGTRATHGSMAIALVPALASRNGLTAAFMAAADFTCSDISIDGRNGLLQVLSPTPMSAPIRQGLGIEFEMLQNAYKPYPCGIVIHPVIDACLDLAAGAGFDPQAIERVDLLVHPDALTLCWRKLPESELQAQVSLFHWAAAALVCGRAGLDQGELACVRQPRVRALQSSIYAEVDLSLGGDQAKVSVRFKDSSVRHAEVTHATGSVDRPMSDAQLSDKFKGLANRVLDQARSAELVQACWNLHRLADVNQFVRLASG